MTAPFFTNNESDITRLEGLYIKERNPPSQISGVDLNTVGIAGECVRGPVNVATEVTSPAEFAAIFGGRDYTANGSGGAIIGKVWQALLNKPMGRLFVVRAAAAAALAASYTLEAAAGGAGTAIVRVDASSVGAWGNSVKVRVGTATDGVANHWNLTVRLHGNDVVYENLDTTTGVNNLSTVLGDSLSNLIVMTKLADGRPVNNAASTDGADTEGFVTLGATQAGYVSVLGTDGTIADTDYTAANGPIDLLTAAKGVSVVTIAERMSVAIKDKLELVSTNAVDRLFLIGTDASNTTVSAAITEAAGYRSDRIIYCFNHFYTRDPDTNTLVLCSPTSLMASILSQTEVDIHVGDFDNRRMAAGLNSLYFGGLSRQDYINLKAAGISALEQDEGFGFVSGVTTSLVAGKKEITRRRSADYIQLSIAATLRYSVYKKNTASRRAAIGALLTSFLGNNKRREFIVEEFVVDQTINTAESRALGIERALIRVRMIGHILHLVIETEIGTAVTITEVAA